MNFGGGRFGGEQRHETLAVEICQAVFVRSQEPEPVLVYVVRINGTTSKMWGRDSFPPPPLPRTPLSPSPLHRRPVIASPVLHTSRLITCFIRTTCCASSPRQAPSGSETGPDATRSGKWSLARSSSGHTWFWSCPRRRRRAERGSRARERFPGEKTSGTRVVSAWWKIS